MSSSLAGVTATHALVQVPKHGTPWLDMTLAEEVALTGQQTAVVGGISMQATVVSGGSFQGRARYKLAVGAAGWGNTVAEKAYRDDAGVKVSRVLADLAADCGEQLGPLPTTLRGPHYARVNQPAFVTLNELAPRAWYVGFDGVTQIGQRATTTYTGDAARVRVDKAARFVELALDTIDPTLVPGVVVDGNPPATDVEYEQNETRLTCRVYYGETSDRFFDALGKVIDGLYPQMRYAGVYEYRVVTRTGKKLNLQPVRAQTGMPDLTGVPVRPGVSGWRATVKLGELVLVSFVDRDPSRPVCTQHEDADGPGWFPELCEFGDGGDFVALKTAVDNIQAKLDDFITSKYNMHVHPTGVGPSGVTTSTETAVGAQDSAQFIKVK